jgi:hypothetical protein
MNDFAGSSLFDDIAAQCLDDVLAGRRTVAQCLRAHPEQATDLRPLLMAALLTARMPTPPPMREAAVDALEARLRATMTAPKSLPKPAPRRAPTYAFAFSRMAAMLALGLLLAFGSTGLVSASDRAVPGDALYGLKRLWEAIVLALSPLSGPHDALWIQIAHNRLYEIDVLDEQGRLDEQALTDLHRALYELAQVRTPQNEADVLLLLQQADSLLAQVTPQPEAQKVYDTLSALTQQSVDTGMPALPASEYPLLAESPLMQVTYAPPTPTASATFTATASPTASATPSATPSPTATLSPTPQPSASPTPSRTPPPTPSATPSPTATLTPTATWTALPLPGTVLLTSAAPTLPPGVLPGATATAPPANSDNPRERETQQAVYLTQTVGAPATPAP